MTIARLARPSADTMNFNTTAESIMSDSAATDLPVIIRSVAAAPYRPGRRNPLLNEWWSLNGRPGRLASVSISPALLTCTNHLLLLIKPLILIIALRQAPPAHEAGREKMAKCRNLRRDSATRRRDDTSNLGVVSEHRALLCPDKTNRQLFHVPCHAEAGTFPFLIKKMCGVTQTRRRRIIDDTCPIRDETRVL